jgi:hypothetical protein
MKMHLLVTILATGCVLLVNPPHARAQAAGAPAKTCDQLKASAGADELAQASTGKWTTTSVGPVFRAALITARANKRIQAKCAAEGKTADAADALAGAQSAFLDNYAVYVEYMGYRRSLSEIEEKRFDKQVGATASAAGTTSSTTKGTVPALLGFAVENGALLKSTNGSTVTFQAVPLNVVKALAAHDYIASAPRPVPGTLSGILSDVSVSVSFDTSRGTPANTFTGNADQVSAYGLRYQILNWRDPRNVRYAKAWEAIRTGPAAALAAKINTLGAALRAPAALPPEARPSPTTIAALDEWRTATAKLIENATVDDLETVAAKQAEKFKAIAEQSPVLMEQINDAGRALVDYFLNRNDEIKRVTKSLALAFEYNEIRQPAPDKPDNAVPDISSLKLVFAKGFVDGPEATGNVSVNLFHHRPAGSTVGNVRDVQASAQLDVPLPEIRNIGRMIVSLSGLVEVLREEPLGQKIVINTVSVDRTGTIGLFQAKLSIPAKGSGVTIPIAVTWSNRTELVLERTTRANIGITLDFDKLFAKN